MEARTFAVAAIPTLWSEAEARGWKRARHILRAPEIEGIALDGDGSRLVATGAGHLFAYDGRTGQELAMFALGDGSQGGWAMAAIFALAFSADGARFVVGETRYTEDRWRCSDLCSIHDAQTLERRHTLPLGGSAVLALGPDSNRLAIADEDKGIEIVSAATGQVLTRCEAREDGYVVRGMAFSPDGERLGVAWQECAVTLYDVKAGSVLCERDEVETGGELALGFSPDGTALVVASNCDGRHDPVAQVVTLRSGKVRRLPRLREAYLPLRVDAARGEVLWRLDPRGGRTDGDWLLRQGLRPKQPPTTLSVPPGGAADGAHVAVSGDGSRIAVALGTAITMSTLPR